MGKNNLFLWIVVGIVLLALGGWCVASLFAGGHPIWAVIVAILFLDLLADVVVNLKPAED